MNSIHSLNYFLELNDKQKGKIISISKEYSCKNGDVVFLQGEFCQNWIIVTEGSFIHRIKSSNSVKEDVLNPGDSFDFIEVMTKSVTRGSLEAVGDSKIVVIDILGLKRLANKNPFLVGLIREGLAGDESKAFDDCIFNRATLRHKNFKIRRSLFFLLWEQFLYLIPSPLFFIFSPIAGVGFLALWSVVSLFRFIFSRFTFIEVSRESVSKKSVKFPKLEVTDISSPIEKVFGTTTSYKNRIHKILKLGSIRVETINGEIEISGVRNPESVVRQFTTYKDSRDSVNKAIDLTSFKNLYSRKNNLFYIDSQLEPDKNSEYRFRKSYFVLFFKTSPPFIIFGLISLLGYYFTGYPLVFLFNVFPVLFIVWETWDWVNDKYEFRGSRVIDIEKKPLWGKEKRKEAEITSVQSINKVQKSILEFIFNYGTIEVETLTDKFIYPYISNPDKVVENLYLVKEYYHSVKESQEKLERQEEFLNYSNYLQELTK